VRRSIAVCDFCERPISPGEIRVTLGESVHVCVMPECQVQFGVWRALRDEAEAECKAIEREIKQRFRRSRELLERRVRKAYSEAIWPEPPLTPGQRPKTGEE